MRAFRLIHYLAMLLKNILVKWGCLPSMLPRFRCMNTHFYPMLVVQAVPKIKWGKHTRVILDVGCGVASFGGYIFERDVLTMSFAPKDEHEAQVQFALERGIPAISAVMGSQRLPFPSRVFDLIHCARCRVPWHAEGYNSFTSPV